MQNTRIHIPPLATLPVAVLLSGCIATSTSLPKHDHVAQVRRDNPLYQKIGEAQPHQRIVGLDPETGSQLTLTVQPRYYSAAGRFCRHALLDGQEMDQGQITVCQGDNGEWFRAPVIYSQQYSNR